MSRRRRRREPGIIREILGWIVYIIVILGLNICSSLLMWDKEQVSAGHPWRRHCSDGDQLIVDKISYRFHDPKRYDIIVFPYQYEENTYYIKRIIGLPGETVQVKDGYVYINGEKLESVTFMEDEVMDDPGIAARANYAWEMMNILCLAITGITVRTAVIRVLE